MLILTLKVDESIYIDDHTIITVIEKWTGEAVLQVETDQVITIDDAKPKDENLRPPHPQNGLDNPLTT